MSLIPRFAAYAAAFERAYESNEWSDVEDFFSEDVVYEIGLPILGETLREGRDEVLAWFPDVLDRFDRQFDSRELELLDGPTEKDDEVWILGTATYRSEGFPDLVLELEETIRYEGDDIIHLVDSYTDEMKAQVRAYALEHGEALGIDWSETSEE
jgi:hypothetical protein